MNVLLTPKEFDRRREGNIPMSGWWFWKRRRNSRLAFRQYLQKETTAETMSADELPRSPAVEQW